MTAEIGVYDSAACDNQIDVHTNYTRGCQKYAYPRDSGACRLYVNIQNSSLRTALYAQSVISE